MSSPSADKLADNGLPRRTPGLSCTTYGTDSGPPESAALVAATASVAAAAAAASALEAEYCAAAEERSAAAQEQLVAAVDAALYSQKSSPVTSRRRPPSPPPSPPEEDNEGSVSMRSLDQVFPAIEAPSGAVDTVVPPQRKLRRASTAIINAISAQPQNPQFTIELSRAFYATMRGLFSARRIGYYLRYNSLDLIARILCIISLTLADEYGGGDHANARVTIMAKESVLSYTVLVLWLRLLKVLSVTSTMGSFVYMLGRMLSDISQWLIIYAFAVISFASALFVLFRNHRAAVGPSTIALGEECVTLDEVRPRVQRPCSNEHSQKVQRADHACGGLAHTCGG